MSENNMRRLTVVTSKHAEENIKYIAKAKGVTFSRLIAIAIDNEMERDNPFEFDTTFPLESTAEKMVYSIEGGKILSYMQNIKGAALETLVLLRHDIGISDKQVFLAALKEVIDNDLIEGVRAKPRVGTPDKGHLIYRIKQHGTPKQVKRKKNKQASEYNVYMRLKKKFESEA